MMQYAYKLEIPLNVERTSGDGTDANNEGLTLYIRAETAACARDALREALHTLIANHLFNHPSEHVSAVTNAQRKI
jgi:hypothetical protein